MRQARLSMKQEVCFGRKESFNSLWVIQPLNPDAKLRLEGKPVPSHERVLIFHKATNTPLAAQSNYSFKTEFGAEYELFASSISGLKKVYGLSAEKLGKRASDMVEAQPQHGNFFALLTSGSEGEGQDNRNLERLTSDVLLQLVRETIYSKGINCYRGLAKVLRVLDIGKSGKLPREEFKYGLREYGIPLDGDEFNLLVSKYDKGSRDGYIAHIGKKNLS